MWKMIEGYKYPYRVNEDGVVQGCRYGVWKDKKIQLHHSQISTKVCLVGEDGKPIQKTVGMLMAQAFLGDIPPGCKVFHKNGIKTDNRLCNLVVAPTQGHRTGLGDGRRKAVAAYNMAGKMVRMYPSIREAARKEHVCVETIRTSCKDNSGALIEKTGHRYRFVRR